MAHLLENQTTDTTSSPMYCSGGALTMLVSGSFGCSVLDMEVSAPGENNWVKFRDFIVTQTGIYMFEFSGPIEIRVALSGCMGQSSVTVQALS